MTESSPSSGEVEASGSDPFWTIANAFSLLRMVLVPPTLWALYQGDEGKPLMVSLVLAMILSDWLDGYLARKLNSTSRWGHVLDPLADKLALDSIAITLVLLKGLPFWVAAVLVGRDAAIVLAGIFLLARERVVQPSNIWGKATSLSLSMLLLAYATDFLIVAQPLLWASALLLVVSTWSYSRRFFSRQS